MEPAAIETKSTGKKQRIKDYSEGLWRLTIVLTAAAPVVGWLILYILDETHILSVRKEEILILGSLFVVVPFIAVESWLWIKRGYQVDAQS